MESNPSAKDPKSVWQKQPTETSQMSILLIHRMARKSREKTRKELVGPLSVLAVCTVFAAIGIVKGFGWAQRAWFGAALLWCITGAWVYQRGMWAAELPGGAGLETGLAFLRRELGRQRDLFRRSLVWALGPVLFTIAAAVVPLFAHMWSLDRTILLNLAPFFTLLLGWFVIMVRLRNRKKRELQRELDELNAIEKENR